MAALELPLQKLLQPTTKAAAAALARRGRTARRKAP
jgi:hypothetical protein